MLRSITFALAVTFLAPAALAGTQSNFQVAISVNTSALSNSATAAAELDNVKNQARDACRYRPESVLSNRVDSRCVDSIVNNVVERYSNPALVQATQAASSTEG
ncbi:UrcA family protein [Ponticaulis profundi]|uniref:UrcA family protein n=1 Tax=Ponticaulis profundi TaxID=2665222 RepID=A0ABW1S5L6_9PROT